MTVSGGCLCGKVTFEGRGDPAWVVHCHCRNCQRASGAGFLTYVGFMSDRFEWTGKPPETYSSSPGVERGFCSNCGSTLSFARPDRGEISVFAGVLDNPNGLTPTGHAFFEQHMDWLVTADDAPRWDRHPPGNEDRDM